MNETDYRHRMKHALKAAGEFFADNAEQFIESLPENTHTVSFSINFEADSFPEVEITTASIPQVVINGFSLMTGEKGAEE